jgi:hypothetical protein
MLFLLFKDPDLCGGVHYVHPCWGPLQAGICLVIEYFVKIFWVTVLKESSGYYHFQNQTPFPFFSLLTKETSTT